MKKKLNTFYLMMLAIISLFFASCSSNDNDSTSDVPSGKESNSPLIGTWVNDISSEIFYALVFRGDGTGFYVEESNNIFNFSYRTFKFTTIPFKSTTDSNTENGKKDETTTQNETKIGSVEIAFDDGGKSVDGYIGAIYDVGTGGTGEYAVNSDGQLQLTKIAGVEKTIFTTTTKNLYARPDIEGYWTNETTSMDSSDKIVMMQVNKNNSGNITVLNDNIHPGVYASSIYTFSSFDVFNDIFILHLADNATKTIRVLKTTNSGSECLRTSIASTLLNKSSQPSNIEPGLLEGQWIGYTGEYSEYGIYMRVMGGNKMFACSFHLSHNEITNYYSVDGKYSLSGRMLRVSENNVSVDDEINTEDFYIINLESKTMNVYTSVISYSSGIMKRVDLTKKKTDALESRLIGTWDVTGYWPYADYRPKSFTFASDGSYSMLDYSNDLIKGYFMVKDNQLYLFGNGDIYDVRIEDNILYLDDYTFAKR